MYNAPQGEKKTKSRFVLPSLAIARFAVSPPRIATGLLLIDIASTFGRPVGVMGQIRTVSSAVGMIMSLLMAGP